MNIRTLINRVLKKAKKYTDSVALGQGAVQIKGDKGDTGPGVPSGGTTGQLLAKNSNANQDTVWKDPPSGGSANPADLVSTEQDNALGLCSEGKLYVPQTSSGGFTPSPAQSAAMNSGVTAQKLTDIDTEISEIKGDLTAIDGELTVNTQKIAQLEAGKTSFVEVEAFIDEHNTSGTAHPDIRQAVNDARSIAEGRNQAKVFATFEAMDTWLSDQANIDTLNVGDNLYILALDVPDYWWDGAQAQKLETEKVDLTDYLTETEVNDLLSGKVDNITFNAFKAATEAELARLEDEKAEKESLEELQQDFTDHHEDDGQHVSATDRAAWNAKQEPPKSLTPAYVNSFPDFLSFVRGTPNGVYHIADPDSMPSNTWADRPRDGWRNDRNIVVIEKVGIDATMEGTVRVYETTGDAPAVFRTWYEDGWARPWTEIGGNGSPINDPDISKVYNEHIDAEKKRIDELQPGDYVVSLEMHNPFGDPHGGAINFDHHTIEFQPYGGVIVLTGDVHNATIRSMGDVYATVVPVEDTFVDFSGDWDDVFYAYVGDPAGHTKRWDNRELLEAIREIDPETGGRNTFTIEPDLDNYDPVNKITARNTSWTVPLDVKLGYVRCAICGANTANLLQIRKNGRAVKSWSEADGTGLNDVMFRVVGGDVITLWQVSGNAPAAGVWSVNPFDTTGGRWAGCYFIPAKIVWATSDAAKFNVNLIGPPDYDPAKVETVAEMILPATLTSPQTMSWKSDRAGYFFIESVIWVSTVSAYIQFDIFVDGVNLSFPENAVFSSSGGASGSQALSTFLIPIGRDRLIEFKVSGASNVPISAHADRTIRIKFIPPESVAPIALTGVDMIDSDKRGKLKIDPFTKEASINGLDPDNLGGGYSPPAGGIPKADLSTEVKELLDAKPNIDAITCLWQGERVILKPNENLMAMTGGLQYELTFLDVPNALDIDLTSHLILDAKLFDPIDELFGYNPGDVYSSLEWMFQEIHQYCEQYGEFDYNDWHDQNIYDYIQQILEMLNIIDQINPRLMSLKMDFQYAVEDSSNPVTVMPVGIYGVKGSNMILIPHIKKVGGI